MGFAPYPIKEPNNKLSNNQKDFEEAGRTTRNPMVPPRLSGLFLYRIADRQYLAVSAQSPPRIMR